LQKQACSWAVNIGDWRCRLLRRMSPLVADIVAKVFSGWRTKILRAADASSARRREGPYRFIQNRSRTSVAALKSDAAAEKSKDQLSRNFRCRSIFDFLQQYRHFSDVPGRPDYVRSWGVKRKGKAVRSAQLTANRHQPMQMKRHARLKEAGVCPSARSGHGRGSKFPSFHYRD
jgi:hypothetical protein